MTRSTIKRLTEPLDEPEREFRRLRRVALRSHQNDSLAIARRNLFDDEASSSNNTGPKRPTPPKTLHEHSRPTSSGFQNPITGLITEDPLRHVKHYLSIVDNIQADGATRDTSRLRFFHFSLKGKAAEWLDRIPPTQDLINQVPHHGIQKWILVQIFHDNISQDDRRKLNQFTQFCFHSLTEEEGWIRIKEYVQYQDDLWDDMSPPLNISSILKTMQPTFRGRLKRACNQISYLETSTREVGLKTPYLICDYCGGSHEADECKQLCQAEQVCLSRGDIYNDPFLLRNKFEDELANFMLEKKSHAKGIGDMLVQHRKELHEQYSQILSTISKSETPKPEALTFAITTRSGIITQDPPFPAPPRPATDNFTEKETEKEGPDIVEPKITQEPAPRPSILYPPSKISNLPFPSRLKNIHMPKGAKVLKDLLSHKEKLEKEATLVKLSEECSTIIQRSLSQKEGDPGSFTLPCLIGPLAVKNALADLWATINLMPHSLFQRLGISKLKPTKMSIQLADRSIKYPIRICENLLVKVGKFIFPVDFEILEIDEDELVPIILGWPFLATARAVINVHEGKLSLRVGNETITFNIRKSMKSKHSHDDYLHCADYIAKLIQEQWVDTVNQDEKWTEEEEEEDSNKALAVSFYPRSKPVEPLEWKAPDNRLKPSSVEPSKLELKELPEYLEYAFLQEDNQLLVVISSALTTDKKNRLLEVLQNHKGAIAWSITDIKGIDSSFCTHKILMEDKFKPSVQPQRRVNPNIKEVLPKKGGMTVVKNEKEELIPQCTVTRWRVCIDNLNFLRRLFVRFGIPKALISDRGTHFCNYQMEKAMERYGVVHRFSTAYHPQINGQVENTNRAIKRILEKTIGNNMKDWSYKLDDALWAFRTTFKTPLGTV
ncbi:DNA-directed DNA polymerase [Tanacetum coccineum]